MLYYRDRDSMEARFRELCQTLPTGSDFRFREAERDEDGWDGFILDMISIPQGARGVGTKCQFRRRGY